MHTLRWHPIDPRVASAADPTGVGGGPLRELHDDLAPIAAASRKSSSDAPTSSSPTSSRSIPNSFEIVPMRRPSTVTSK